MNHTSGPQPYEDGLRKYVQRPARSIHYLHCALNMRNVSLSQRHSSVRPEKPTVQSILNWMTLERLTRQGQADLLMSKPVVR